jgi:ferritin-like metal-binding protein YciE
MAKLPGHLATHVTDEEEAQIKALADLVGISASEYLRDLIMSHLAEKHRQFQSMHRIFGSANGAAGAERTVGNGEGVGRG